MKYAIERGSGAGMYVPSFIKFGSGIKKLMGGGGLHRRTDTKTGFTLHKSALYFQNQESKLKRASFHDR
jgi:hypothetical protein